VPGPAYAGDEIVRYPRKTLGELVNSVPVIQANCLKSLTNVNTVEEHNELSSYGENPDNGWIDEGDLPEEDDSTYERKFSVVKYIGTTRRVTHVNMASLAA
jgi:hypothetical protein